MSNKSQLTGDEPTHDDAFSLCQVHQCDISVPMTTTDNMSSTQLVTPPPPALPGYYRQQGTASGRVTSRVRLWFTSREDQNIPKVAAVYTSVSVIVSLCLCASLS